MEQPQRPLPVPDPDSMPYWEAASQRKLLLQVCPACDKWIFYPRSLCPNCSSTALEWREPSGKGTVFSHTTVYQAPTEAFAAEIPYTVGLVDLDEGARMYARIKSSGPAIEIGERVEVAFESLGEGVSLPYFVVTGSDDH